MQYLTVGISDVRDDLFKPVEDTDGIKPRRGIWLTKFDPRYKNYNEWVDFLLDNPVTFFYKNKGTSIWEQPCSIVTLKEDAKIFQLDSKESFQYLVENYPYNDHMFSYQKMSQDYDGIFVKILGLLSDITDGKLREQIFKFAVDSLILFNVSCIDYYQSGVVSIEPFDYEYGEAEMTSYEIKYDDVKKKIRKK